jgi:hypothetical protein
MMEIVEDLEEQKILLIMKMDFGGQYQSFLKIF